MMRFLAPGILSGVLMALSLPKPDLYALAWVALVPWFLSIWLESNTRRTVATSYAAGFVFFAGTFYWISETMVIYGGIGGAAAVGVGLLFAAVYAFYFVLFGVGLSMLIQRFRIFGLFAAAPLWVSIELLRTYLFSGFPWMLSGYALAPYEGILQVVTWTGVYGLSFIATAVNACIACGVISRNRLAFGAAAAAILAAVQLPITGEVATSSEAITVRLVQTNISLDQPWKQPAATELLDELQELSSGTETRPVLIVWPETPAPFYLQEDTAFRVRMQEIARKTGSYVVLGYIDKLGERPSNSAAVIAPNGDIISRYDKIHLVPFGEYVPLKPLLFFAESLTRQVGDFTPGTEYTISSLGNLRISTAICYESIFPDLVRQFVKRGSELIVVITNDGWFGESSAPFQHLRMGVVRAVENRRYVVRTANTGISAIIDPYGRIHGATPIGKRLILEGTAYSRTDLTFYTQYGDVFAYLNALVVLMCYVLVVWRKSYRPLTLPSPRARWGAIRRKDNV